jgi:hypothetical protein
MDPRELIDNDVELLPRISALYVKLDRLPISLPTTYSLNMLFCLDLGDAERYGTG